MDDENTVITDDDMQALVDGSLEAEKRSKALSVVIRSPELLARYHELLEQKDFLKNWWNCFKKEN